VHSLTPRAVHSHAYLGSLNYPIVVGTWTPAAEETAHPNVPVASGLVFRKAPRIPHPTRHGCSSHSLQTAATTPPHKVGNVQLLAGAHTC